MAAAPKSTSTTKVISYVALGLFVVYALFYVGATGFLFSIATGLIVFSFVESVEIAAAIVILVGLLYKYLLGPKTKYVQHSTTEEEGYENNNNSADDIISRVASFAKVNPKPTYSSPFVEGFADASSASNGSAQGEQNDEAAATSATSKPATIASTTTESVAKATLPAAALVQNFKDGGSSSNGIQADGLFKLGELPTETKGGGHIDQGTTLMNAIGSLKPDQIQSMTEDTRKLLDTQKSLMSMLNTMKPMLNDGKQLMDTFQQMFGSGGNGGSGAGGNGGSGAAAGSPGGNIQL